MISSRFALRWDRLGASTVLSLALAVFSTTLEAADAVKVGVNGVSSDVPFFIAQEKGYFEEEDLDVEIVPFERGPQMVAPLAAGQIDVGAGASSASLYNAVTRDLDIRAVADKGSMPGELEYCQVLVRTDLHEDGQVQSYSDLKGLKIAEVGRAGASGALVNAALRKGGLTYSDAEHIHISHPQMVTSFVNGAIDAAVVCEPFATQTVEMGAAVRISEGDYATGQQVAVLLYGASFIDDRREVAERFMRAYLKGARFYVDAIEDGVLSGPNADEVIRILTENTSLKDPELVAKITPHWVDPNGRLGVETLAEDLRFFEEQGYLDAPVTVDMAIDPSFAERAVEVLGEYESR